MKAVVYTHYGPPDVLRVQDVEKPVTGDQEVLVKVQAASLNFGDKALMRGKPLVTRLMGYGLRNPKFKILGTDIAGVVETIGGGTSRLQPGDAVFADLGDSGFGAFAEYAAVPESAVAPKPANTTYTTAAAVPQAGVVALQGLRDCGQVQADQSVLINGASGGIGTFAVQIAKSFGAEVTGICSTRNVDLVYSIGADRVIDYTREDFTQNEFRYDLIFDIVANRPISNYLRSLKPRGRYVACAFNPTSLFFSPLISKADGKHVSSLSHKPDQMDLVFMKELLESRQVEPVIDRVFTLDKTAEAMRYLENGQVCGKVVLSIDPL
jgi:NADPH:quinone reductase-like Zn-dependent oxidoreductase